MSSVYSVRTAGELEVRRRGGVEFSQRPSLVSVEAAGEGVVTVTEQQLAAILADQHLRAKEVIAPQAHPANAEAVSADAPVSAQSRRGRKAHR